MIDKPKEARELFFWLIKCGAGCFLGALVASLYQPLCVIVVLTVVGVLHFMAAYNLSATYWKQRHELDRLAGKGQPKPNEQP
jgi:hypothetical protein